MDLHDRRGLKAAARDSLVAAPYDPRKLILFHAGVTIAVSLLGTLLNFVLSKQIDGTGGLGGLGLRSMLSTVQSILQLMVAIALPFWEAGYTYATMKIARNEETAPDSLLMGFRRFGPLFRLNFTQGLIFAVIGIGCFFVGYYIFMLTPLSDSLFAIIETIDINSVMTETEIILDDATLNAMADAYTPMILISLVLFLIVGIFISYRFRMATYLLLDHPHMRAMEALRMSTYQLKCKLMALFKLDLSFLWFFALEVLVSMLAYGDYLLALFNVPLPVSPEVAYFGFLVLSLVCQAGLFIWARNRVYVTYAKFYLLTALPLHAECEEGDVNNQ